jgi:HD-like signal output (HDOD) protein
MPSETSKTILHEIIKQINKNALQLASMPDVIVKVNNVLNDDRKGVNDIAKVIQNEIALSSRIIQIANSPALRGNSEIKSMSDAINRLGISLVKNLAICVSLKDKFNSRNLIHKDLMAAEMLISNRRSVYGFMIAKHLVQGLTPEVSLIAGLVSKIGQTVVIRYMNDHAEYKTLTSVEVKKIVDEIGDEIGDLILRRWEFPTDIIDAVFGRVLGDIRNPTTYRDVYVIADKYISHFNTIKDTIQIYTDINEMLQKNKEDLDSLEAIFN